MPGNSFGDLFRITTFGESHGEAIGVVIDGCPSGLEFDHDLIKKRLEQRRPGRHEFVTDRSEKEEFKVLSGVYENKTTGSPITILITNSDQRPQDYQLLKDVHRPGHASYTYFEKYGIYDHRGGGRASARETAARVAAGAVAEMILEKIGIHIQAYLTQVGPICITKLDQENSDIFCPDSSVEPLIKQYLLDLKQQGDSSGGRVMCCIKHLPLGLGEPVFDRFEAKLAHAMLSIPATKGFEIGEGFGSVVMRGSMSNDSMSLDDGHVKFDTNHAGGTLGGITNGENVVFHVAFKPTSSIKKEQKTLNFEKKQVLFTLPPTARHDPCVAIRGTVVVRAMAYLVTCDFLLKTKNDRIIHVLNSQNHTASSKP